MTTLGLVSKVAFLPSDSDNLLDRVERFFEHELTQMTGLELRQSQRAMAVSIARVLQDGGRLAVEAQTGTGKSLAYLIPLLLRNSPVHQAAVVATKTLQLQEQLMRKDLPLLQSLLPAPRNVVQARGWNNYLCLRKIESPGEETVRELGPNLPRLKNLANESGGRLTRGQVSLPATSWQRIQADPVDCQKQRCPHFSRCGLFAERRELENADLIITNHAFLLSDLKVRRDGGGLLPDCDVLVLDEAHRLDDVATDHLAVRFDAERLHSVVSAPLHGWLESVRFALLAYLPETHLLEWSSRFDSLIIMALKDIEGLGERVLAEIAAAKAYLSTESPNLPHAWLCGTAGELLANLASELSYGLDSLVGELTSLAQEYGELSPMGSPPELARLARSLRRFAEELDFLLSGVDPDWVFLCEPLTPALVARPIDNSQTLNSELFSGYRSVVATSATLRVNDSFHFFLQRCGLGVEPTLELTLESPFDTKTATFVGLASGGPDPNDPGFAHALSPHLYELIVGLRGRTFVLTTSHRRLIEFARLLGPPLEEAGVELLVQGQAPAPHLLRRFNSPGAHALLGVDTFWEGVDIPGERLSCVVLTRLPFPVPNDPLFAARAQRIERQGGNSFDHLSLPLTALKLKQGFGRLLRGASDRGVFLLLDPRVGRKAYGRTLTRHLPGPNARYGLPEFLVAEALAWSEANLQRVEEPLSWSTGS